MDTTLGSPAAEVKCEISLLNGGDDAPFAVSQTDKDGRVKSWSINSQQAEWLEEDITPGVYKIRFHTKEYFQRENRVTFFPFVDIVFEIPVDMDKHYHVPLLLSNYGYSTYRGS